MIRQQDRLSFWGLFGTMMVMALLEDFGVLEPLGVLLLSPFLLCVIERLVRLNKILKSSFTNAFAASLGAQFPEQWEDFEDMFRHLDDARLWELNSGTPQLAVELRYYRDWLYTWPAFLTAIALGSIKKAFFRLSQ